MASPFLPLGHIYSKILLQVFWEKTGLSQKPEEKIQNHAERKTVDGNDAE